MSARVGAGQAIPFRWKLYWVVLSLLALGVLAKVPPFILAEGLVGRPEAWGQVTALLFIEQFFIFGLIPASLGVFLIARLGLRMPLLEEWLLGVRAELDKRRLVWHAALIALSLAVVGIASQTLITRELDALGLSAGQGASAAAQTTWWSMLLLAFSAGVVEEIVFRLGLLTTLAAVASVIWKPRQRMLRSEAFWAANVTVAVFFAAAHLLNYAGLGIALPFGLVWTTMLANSVAALVFGWLYWRRGLESAILTHVLLDVLVYVIVPFRFAFVA